MMQVLAREIGEGKWDIQIRREKVKCVFKNVTSLEIIRGCKLKFNIQNYTRINYISVY